MSSRGVFERQVALSVLFLCSLFLILACGGAEGTAESGIQPLVEVSPGIDGKPMADAKVVAPFDLGNVIRQVKYAFRPEGDTFTGGALGYAVTTRKDGAFAVTPRHEPTEGTPIIGAPVRFETVSLGDGAAAQSQDGHLAIARGVVTEHLRNSEEGVEQSWSFAARPTGTDDIVIRVAVSGMAYIGETEKGLHFAEESGIGVRYGHAKWIDNDKKETAIPAVFRDGNIELTVPRELVDGSTYPAVLDPVIGPEFGMDQPVAVPQSSTQYYPRVAFDGTNYLVVWQDNRNGTWDIYGARVSKVGSLLDTLGIAISGANSDQQRPAVAFNGTNYLVVWQDNRNGSYTDVYGARVKPDGTVLDASGIAMTTANYYQQNVDVASDGTNWFVVWQDYRTGGSFDIYGARVNGAGSVLDGSGILISNANWDQDYPAVAFDGTNYLVVWADYRTGNWDIYGGRVKTDGTVLEATATNIMISNASNTQEWPDVAFNGTNYLVVWHDVRTGSWDIYGGRVATNGTVLDGTGVAISAAGNNQNYPVVASDGTNYFVVWLDYRSGGSDIYGARVDTYGNTTDPLGILVSNATNSQELPSIVFDGTNYFAVWHDNRNGGNWDIYGARIAANGTVTDTTGILISSGMNNQYSPAVAYDGTNYLVVWQDYRSTIYYDIFGTRVAPDGTVLDTTGIAVSIASNNQQYPAVAFDGTNYLVVWHDYRSGNWDIYGTRVSTAGTVQDPSGIAISTSTNTQYYPAVAFDGTNYAVVWQDARNGNWDIYGARVNTDGTILDASGLILSNATNQQEYPEIAFDGTNYLVVWQDYRSGATYDIYGSRVNKTLGVLDNIAICTVGNHQQYPAVAFDGTNYLVVWQDLRSGSNYDIYGQRVVAATGALTGSNFPIANATNGQEYPAVAFAGTEYFVVWQDYSGSNYNIYGSRVATNGTIMDLGGRVLSDDSYHERYPALARGAADNYLLAYESIESSGEYRIKGRILDFACAAGTYGDGFTCTPCAAGKYNPLEGQRTVVACLPCAAGSVSDAGAAACTPCAAGTYQSGNACLACAAGTYNALEGQTSCTQCDAGTYAAGTGNTGCTDCAVGSFAANPGQASCDDCPVGQYNALTGQAACTECAAGTYADTTGNVACTDCAVGHYQENTGQTGCDACPAGTIAAATGQDHCDACDAGTYATGTGNDACTDCDAGSFAAGTGQDSCDACPVGHYNMLTGQAACTECAAGTYADTTGNIACTECAIGHYQQNTGQTACSICLPGTYAAGTGNAFCPACDPGSIAPVPGSGECTLCAAGHYQQNSGQTICNACATGTYADTEGAALCTKCPVGEYAAGTASTACTACAAGTYAPVTGQSACLDCPVGRYAAGTGNSECTACAAGTYADTTGNTACTACVAGTYNPATGQSACLACAAGSYTDDTGNISCTLCAAGYAQSGTGQTSCEPCNAGKYSPSAGQSACLACTPGTYTADDGLGKTACLLCAAGQVPNGAQTGCESCVAGTYAASGSVSCSTCAPGYYSAVAAASCSACTPGTVSSADHTSCDPCALGTYNPATGQSACLACAAGTFADTTGNIACTACLPGTYQDTTGQISCYNCASGTFAANPGSASCTPCAKGYYNAGTGQSACTACTAGHYAATTGQTACDPCSAGQYNPSIGQMACLNCAPGSYTDTTGNTACTPCAPGEYQPASGQIACVACEEGTYAANTGSVACAGCPTGMDSLAGADSCSPICGDGLLVLGEACDDGNEEPGDGCADDCTAIEPNWICPDAGEPCVAVCNINGMRYTEGEVDPDNICQYCHTATSREAWTGRITGTPCADEGLACTADVCDGAGNCGHPVATGCLIDDTCVATGALDPDNDCRDCNPALATDSYSERAKGLACADDGQGWTTDICDGAGLCTHPETGRCVILGVEYAGGAADPDNACQMCDPENDPDDWSARVEGFPCVADTLDCTWDVCDGAGACEHRLYTGCLIGGACIATGAFDPLNDCMDCAPTTATDAYSARTKGVACADDGIVYTTDTCDGAGACSHLETGTCTIDEVSFAGGAPNPENACQMCDPALDQFGWSDRIENFPCETDDRACTLDVCDGEGTCLHTLYTGCLIGESCVATGVADPTNPCMACDPAAATDAYSARIDGYPCTEDGDDCTYDLCDAGACAHPVKNTLECQQPDEDGIVDDGDAMLTDEMVTDEMLTDETVSDEMLVDEEQPDDTVTDEETPDEKVDEEEPVDDQTVTPDEATDEVTTDEVTGDEVLTDEDNALVFPEGAAPKDTGCGCSLLF
ncbi:MAG TPA: DUF4215 domain-containing protein [bacterium]|nr:DUF4215 domain-containing protein [bacterium]